MSHHYSGPNGSFPHGDARLDLTDLFTFPKPGETGKSILVMDVHPSVGLNPPGPTTDEPFAPGALYEIRIDTNSDAIADITYQVRFASSASLQVRSGDGLSFMTCRRCLSRGLRWLAGDQYLRPIPLASAP